MNKQTIPESLDKWAIKVSNTSDQLTEQINSIRQTDEKCGSAFIDFLKALTEIYPSLNILDCVNMISESIIIGPIQKILFDPATDKFDTHLHGFEQKVIETLKPYSIPIPVQELEDLYSFIKAKSEQLEKQQLIKKFMTIFINKLSRTE